MHRIRMVIKSEGRRVVDSPAAFLLGWVVYAK